MSKLNIRTDVDTAFAAHFEGFVQNAGHLSLLAASETETNPGEIRRFAEYRFTSLLRAFESSFRDSWNAIGEPFRRAALNGGASRRGER